MGLRGRVVPATPFSIELLQAQSTTDCAAQALYHRFMSTPALVDDLSISRPHVVILGAGASAAAFPKGDRNGRRLPLMDDLVQVVSWAAASRVRTDRRSRWI